VSFQEDVEIYYDESEEEKVSIGKSLATLVIGLIIIGVLWIFNRNHK